MNSALGPRQTSLVAGVAIAAIISGGTSVAAPDVNAENQNRILIERAFKAWRDGTGGPFELLAENASWTITGHSAAAKTYSDKASFMREVIGPFNARMRERLIPTVRELVVDGNRIVVRFDAAATAKDGRPYVNTYAWFLTVRDGKIVDAIAFFDSIAFDDFWTRVPSANSATASTDI